MDCCGDGTAFEHIELKISRQNGDHRTLLFTLSVYLTTGVIMCQGAAYDLWCTKEFPQMKQYVNEIYSSAQGASDGSEHLGMNADGELITNLEEAFQLVQSMKKKRSSKKETNVVSEDEIMLADDPIEELQHTKKDMQNVLETPKQLPRKRRNSLDPVRGLSPKSRASLAEIKSVVSHLESDVIEIKNSLLAKPEDHYNSTINNIEDKLVQIENSFKAQMGLFSSRVIDLELDNDVLKQENSKLKNEIQSLKRQFNKTMTKNTPPRVDSESTQISVNELDKSANGNDKEEFTEETPGNDLPDLSNNRFFPLLEHTSEDISSTTQPIQNINEGERPKPELIPGRQKTPTPHQINVDTAKEDNNPHPDIILLIDSNGKFIDSNKFVHNKTVEKCPTPTIATAIETISTKNFDRPSTLVIHTGTNDIEHSTLESCFDNFQTLIDLTAQKYPATKIIISSLITRNDGYDTKRSQLNNKISQLRFYANVHLVNNENITQEMLYDRKHIQKRKIGTLVANLKDCTFNRIPRRPHPAPPKEQRNWAANKTTGTSSLPNVQIPAYNSPPPLMSGLVHPTPAPTTRTPKSYADAAKTLDNNPATHGLNQTVLMQLVKLCEMLQHN